MRLTWNTYLVAALLLALLAAVFGEDVQAVVLLAVVVSSIAFMVRGCRRNPSADPFLWYGLSAATILFIVAGVIADAMHAGAPQGAGDYPHFHDYLDLIAYMLAVSSMYRVVRIRAREADPSSLLDGVILPGGIVIALWALVWVPNVENELLTFEGHAINWTFAILSISLTGIIALFVLAPGRQDPAFYLLGIVAIGALGGDVLAAVDLSGRSFAFDEGLSLLLPTAGFAGAGAAALHPSMATVTRPTNEGVAHLRFGRIMMLTAAALVAPMLLLTELRGAPFYVSAGAVAGWVMLVVLIMIRMAGLVHARERIADAERLLNEAAESLVAATDSATMYEAALGAMERLAGLHAGPIRASILDLDDGEWSIGAGRGRHPEPLEVDLACLTNPASPVADALARRTAARLHHVTAPDLVGTVAPCCTVVPLIAAGQLTGAMVLTTEREVSHETLQTLESLSRDLSLALESAEKAATMHQERSERRFRGLIENSRDLVFVVDEHLVPIYMTPAVPLVLGYSDRSLGERPFGELVHPDCAEAFRGCLERGFDRGSSTELRLVDASGNHRWFEVIVSDLTSDPEVGGLVITARDIHARKRADERTARSQERFRSLVQHGADIVAVVDPTGCFSYLSPSVERVLGYPPAALQNRDITELIHQNSHEQMARFASRVDRDSGTPHTVELDVVDASDGIRTLEVTATNLQHEDSIRGTVVNAHDITERIKLERSLRHQALHDDLTGIPNRVLFQDRIDQAVTRRNPGMIAVMVLDLDDFKTVNDGLGHQAGDEFLKILAFRLQQVLRVGDTAARLGGDEFAILIEDAVDRETVIDIASRMLGKIQEPFDIGDRELRITGSLGVVFDDDLDNPTGEDLIRSADAAMYAAKTAGKAKLAVFEESMYLGAIERLNLKADLGLALQRDELHLHYQPVVDLADGSLQGFEALLRWDHPERGPVSPAAFVPLAEETGLIVPIGRWVLRTALNQLRVWQATRAPFGDLRMGVNVSPRQLVDDGIIDVIAQAISEAQVDPGRVTIELTESASIDDDPAAIERLAAIRSLGVDIYADDFGTGYASYASLRSLPFTGVKIDRSLIDGVDGPDNEQARAQVRSMLEMATELRLKTVAEGIETVEQWHVLRELGCQCAQGYYFGRPSTAGELEREPGVLDTPAG